MLCKGQRIFRRGSLSSIPHFGFQMHVPQNDAVIGVKPSFLRRAIGLRKGDRLYVNQASICPSREGRFLESRRFWQTLKKNFDGSTDETPLKPTHFWYDLIGPLSS